MIWFRLFPLTGGAGATLDVSLASNGVGIAAQPFDPPCSFTPFRLAPVQFFAVTANFREPV